MPWKAVFIVQLLANNNKKTKREVRWRWLSSNLKEILKNLSGSHFQRRRGKNPELIPNRERKKRKNAFCYQKSWLSFILAPILEKLQEHQTIDCWLSHRRSNFYQKPSQNLLHISKQASQFDSKHWKVKFLWVSKVREWKCHNALMMKEVDYVWVDWKYQI